MSPNTRSTDPLAGPRRLIRALAVLLAAGVLGACATGPLNTDGVDRELRPADVQAEPETTRQRTVLWGGRIVHTENLADRTRIEVVSYPLDDRSQRPLDDRQPGARFLVYHDGYLETAEFEAGRSITVRGRVDGTEAGRIGEADYEYPVVQSRDIHLWPPRTTQGDSRSRVNFGIGIIFSN